MQKFIMLSLLLSLTACEESRSDTSATSTEAREAKTTPAATSSVIENLRTHLSLNPENRPPLTEQKFAKLALTGKQTQKATDLILADRLATLRAKRKNEFEKKSITIVDKTMRYEYRTLGEKPESGHSLYISMHGGGGAPARVNDAQWQNQIKLYTPKEGIYLAPRAPTNTWNLWHQAHIDPLFDRLIENFIAFEGVNPDKVYLLGYSAGGDGAYQLAPRMADRWAAAAMMAGHPGDAQTWNLRNLPFFIQCGGKDTAYNRNKLAAEWGRKLDKLSTKNPGAYPHKTIVYPQHGHWMNLDCKQAIPWMAKYTRNPWPKKIHWYQDDVTSTRFFWLANKNPKPKQLITAQVIANTITLTVDNSHLKTADSKLDQITLRLSDRLLDLDQAVTVKTPDGKILHQGKVTRTVASIAHSLRQRPDPSTAATATLRVTFREN